MKKNDFIYMLVALLIFLVALPVASDLALISRPLAQAIGFSCLLLIGVWSLRGSGRWFLVGLLLVVAGSVLNVVAFRNSAAVYLGAAIVALMAFLLIAIVTALRQILFSREISVNRLIGAVCVYLLLGTVWALAYLLLDMLTPGSFDGIAASAAHGWDVNWLYFSFVTLTTLGYGDITPLSTSARVLVYTEAISGVFYMAVLVAGLVGAYITNVASATSRQR